MKKALLLCALGTALLGSQVAKADTTYNMTFSGTLCTPFILSCINPTPFSDGGNVSFTTASTGTNHNIFGDQYTSFDITSISGNVTIGSDTYSIGTLQSGAGSLGGDNKLDVRTGNDYSFDPDGLDFSLNLLSGSDADTYTQLLFYKDTATGQYTTEFCLFTCSTVTANSLDLRIDESINQGSGPAATPEPGSLALLGTSILGGAGLLRRRFRV